MLSFKILFGMLFVVGICCHLSFAQNVNANATDYDVLVSIWQAKEYASFEKRLRGSTNNPLEVALVKMDYSGFWMYDYKQAETMAKESLYVANNSLTNSSFVFKYALAKRRNLFCHLSVYHGFLGSNVLVEIRGSVPGGQLIELLHAKKQHKEKEAMLAYLTSICSDFKNKWNKRNVGECQLLIDQIPDTPINNFVKNIMQYSIAAYLTKDFERAHASITIARIEAIQLEDSSRKKHIIASLSKPSTDMMVLAKRVDNAPKLLKNVISMLTTNDVAYIKNGYAVNEQKEFPFDKLLEDYLKCVKDVNL